VEDIVNDREILESVITEWQSGAGAGVVVPTVLRMLKNLIMIHGDGTTIEGACDALEQLSATALRLRDNLRFVQATGSASTETRVFLYGTEKSPLVIMEAGGNQYVMLTLRAAHHVVDMSGTLRNAHGIAMICGPAINYHASADCRKLVSDNRPNIVGIYVKMKDFPKVSHLVGMDE